MLWTVFTIPIVLWLLGRGFHLGGSIIHVLLVIALMLPRINVLGGRRDF